jgi:hypothetical protein
MLVEDLKNFLNDAKDWDLSDWEQDFVLSLEDLLDDDYPPVTPKQEAIMDKMRDKYE